MSRREIYTHIYTSFSLLFRAYDFLHNSILYVYNLVISTTPHLYLTPDTTLADSRLTALLSHEFFISNQVKRSGLNVHPLSQSIKSFVPNDFLSYLYIWSVISYDKLNLWVSNRVNISIKKMLLISNSIYITGT